MKNELEYSWKFNDWITPKILFVTVVAVIVGGSLLYHLIINVNTQKAIALVNTDVEKASNTKNTNFVT